MFSSANAKADKPAYKKKPKQTTKIKTTEDSNKLKSLIIVICLAIAAFYGYNYNLKSSVNRPFNKQKMVLRTGLNDTERYWGTYRPMTYFGLKTRHPHSLVTGLMWYAPTMLRHGGHGIRHWCEQGDNLNAYGWTHHDGRTFGVQEIHDAPFELTTSFVKYDYDKPYGGDWTARIAVRNTTIASERKISLIWYIALDKLTEGHIKYISMDKQNTEAAGINGATEGLGEFQLRLQPIKGRILHLSYLSTSAPSLSKLRETIYTHFRAFKDVNGKQHISLPGKMIEGNQATNFIAIQITADLDFDMDITYQSITGDIKPPKPLTGHVYTETLQTKIREFEKRFEDTFHLRAKGFSTKHLKFAKYALSNLIGGIGYFYGASRVQSVHTKHPVPYWNTSLYTAVPSRSFFPRGFLWDEGFHGLLLSTWDLDIELDIICHWFDLLNVEGWLPREQILGVEALAKVPEEFVTQRNTHANPPTFFLTLKKLLTQQKKALATPVHLATLERLYPRLEAWFQWYNTTQRGIRAGTYLWQGRNASLKRELNPKSLSSGLDDYPRASHPTEDERHLDLRCWIALAASVLSELSTLLGKDDTSYNKTAAYLTDNRILNKLHLDAASGNYADWGLHTDAVELRRPELPKSQTKNRAVQQQQQLEMERFVLKEPIRQFVNTTFGYVNLFPFLLAQLNSDAPQLSKIIHDIRNPDLLWTNYGLRSLSKQSPLYQKYNTEHDPPYWRGAIWININYLALKALHHYGSIECSAAAQARAVYTELRNNIIGNIFNEYQRTGYIWEQYDDTTGHGKGSHPFTGWSSLVVLIMAEQY